MLLTILIALTFASVFSTKTDTLVVLDVVKTFTQPSTITLFLSNKLDAFAFCKCLTSNGFPTSVFAVDGNTMPYPMPPNHAVFVLNLKCDGVEKVFKKANELKLFSSPYRWVWLNNEENKTSHYAYDYLATPDILTDSEIILANHESESEYVLYEVYKRRRNSEPIVKVLGYWTKDAGLVYTVKEKSTFRRRKNFKHTVLNTSIVITNQESLNHLTDKREKHIDSIAKVNYVLMTHLVDTINATFTYSVQTTWGYKDKNTSQWSGMIGELVRNEADIGGTALFFTSDRVAIIDYIAMTTPTKSKFVFRAPKLSYETNVYFLPFHWSVWISTMFLLIIIGFALYIAVKWEWKKKRFTRANNESNETELRDQWLDVILMEFGAFCQQGASSVPFSISGRIITIILFISLMFLYTSYSATIVALLQSPSSKIKTLNDLLHSRMAVGVDDTVFNHFFFQNETEPIRRALYLQKVIPPGQKPRFFPMAVGVKKMREGLFAFHMETGAGYKIVGETFQEDEKCGLHEISFLQVTDPWLAIQKNSSFKELLKIGLRLIQESGIQNREVSLIYTSKPQCLTRGSSFVSVGIVDCYFAAVVFAGGLILSATLFLLEIIIHNRKLFQERRLLKRKQKSVTLLETNDSNNFIYLN